MNPIEYISHHPKVAFIIGSVHLIASYSLKSFEIPTLIMQLFQIGAWSITITVGMVSLYGAFKKWRNK